MSRLDPDAYFDAAAGPLVRPYAVAGGRTQPTAAFQLITIVVATGQQLLDLSPEHAQILGMCGYPVSVAEVSARVRLPVAVIKILLADLLGWRAIAMRAPVPFAEHARPDRRVLEAVLNGLRNI